MKNTFIIGLMAVSVLLAGCGKKNAKSGGSASWVADQAQLISKSQVIAYASADTNSSTNLVLTITDIWKGSHEAVTMGMTNSMPFPFQWPTNAGPFPDGMVLYYYPKDSGLPSAVQPDGVSFIKSGRVFGMTVQEYKTRFGL